MKWSWKIGQIAGIDLRIHATFLLLVGWIGLSYWVAGKSLLAILAGIGFLAALFACVVLHELGHAIAARRFGIRTRDIILLPIGGLARLERIPENPKQELWIALAGPAVNVAIAGILYGWLALTHAWEPMNQLRVAAGSSVERLLVANVTLVLFNLIPALPMDGGRVLRALLARRLSYAKATQIAARVGQALAFAFGILGLFGNPILLAIALFVWFAAGQEVASAQIRSAISGTPVHAAMLTKFETLQPDSTLSTAVHFSLLGSHYDFPVIDAGRMAGIVTQSDLLKALSEHGWDYPVTFVMRRHFPTTEAAEELEVVLQRLQDCECNSMPVVSNGQLVGLVTKANVREYVLIAGTLA